MGAEQIWRHVDVIVRDETLCATRGPCRAQYRTDQRRLHRCGVYERRAEVWRNAALGFSAGLNICFRGDANREHDATSHGGRAAKRYTANSTSRAQRRFAIERRNDQTRRLRRPSSVHGRLVPVKNTRKKNHLLHTRVFRNTMQANRSE